MSEIANPPQPPYYAVIFTSHRTEGDNGYGEIAERIVKLASRQPGFLGVESARESVGIHDKFCDVAIIVRKHLIQDLASLTVKLEKETILTQLRLPYK